MTRIVAMEPSSALSLSHLPVVDKVYPKVQNLAETKAPKRATYTTYVPHYRHIQESTGSEFLESREVSCKFVPPPKETTWPAEHLRDATVDLSSAGLGVPPPPPADSV